MFSNTIKYAIEESIKEFNVWLNKNNYKRTDADMKNAFYQRLRNNFKATEWYNLFNHFGNFEIDNIKFRIEENCVVNLRFELIGNRHSSNMLTTFINNCMREIVLIDYESLKDEMKVYELSDVFTKTIGQINNFKIK